MHEKRHFQSPKVTSQKQLQSRAQWQLTFDVISPLHIGGDNKEMRFTQRDKSEAYQLALWNEEIKTEEQLQKATHLLIPGSTFKGITRSYLDKLGQQFDLKTISPLIEQLYGKVGRDALKGRLWFSDVMIPRNCYVLKSLTPIDRILGSANAPLTVQSIQQGTRFTVTMTVENPTAVDYGLIALFLRSFYEGAIAIGSGTGRGLGQIKLHSCAITIQQFGRQKSVLPTAHFTISKTLISTQYEAMKQGEDMYTWMQFAVDALQQQLVKGRERR